MDAEPLLSALARTLEEHGLEAILIGNAAVALQALRSPRPDAPILSFVRTAADRPRDRAVLDVLEKALEAKKKDRRGKA